MNTRDRNSKIHDLIKPKVLQESNIPLNSHHSNLIEVYQKKGYTINPEHSNRGCYLNLKNMNYAKEGLLPSAASKGKIVSKEEYNKLNENPQKNELQNKVDVLPKDLYFYKNSYGNPIKTIKNSNLQK